MTPAQSRILAEVREAYPRVLTYTGHQARPARALNVRYGLVDIIVDTGSAVAIQAPVWRKGDRVQLDDPRTYPGHSVFSFGTISSAPDDRYPYVQWDDRSFFSVDRYHLARTVL